MATPVSQWTCPFSLDHFQELYPFGSSAEMGRLQNRVLPHVETSAGPNVAGCHVTIRTPETPIQLGDDETTRHLGRAPEPQRPRPASWSIPEVYPRCEAVVVWRGSRLLAHVPGSLPLNLWR